MQRTIFVTSSFPAEAEALLASGLAGHRVVRAAAPLSANLIALDDASPIDAEIVFGQPSVAALGASRRVRWVHLTSAGYTRYVEPAAREARRAGGWTLTTSSSVYAEPCATHALSLVLALLRCLPEAATIQRGDRSWPADDLRARSAVLAGAAVVVLGYGAIGRRIVELLGPFGVDLTVVRERVRGDEAARAVEPSATGDAMARADVVIDVLPEAEATRGFVSRERIARMKPTAFFVNVGRGVTVDQEALADALEAGRLGGAGLDVTDPEPLPPGHRLWTAPRCLITPHTAGGRRDEHLRLVRHFLEQLGRWKRGEELMDRVT